ncbi:MAG: alpha-galactosidase, partial [Acidobacteriota bacterium]
MKKVAFLVLSLAAALAFACRPSTDRSSPPPLSAAPPDWLIDPDSFKANIKADGSAGTIELSNGLISRTFRLKPAAATVDFRNLVTGEAILRAVRPEAEIVVDGKPYPVGGLESGDNNAYVEPARLAGRKARPGSFRFRSYETGPIRERFAWKRRRVSEGRPWPPAGLTLTLHFDTPEGGPAGLAVSVVYELYDGLPLVSKRIVVRNGGPKPVRLNSFKSEILAAVESESAVTTPGRWEPPALHVESDYSFLSDTPGLAVRATSHWEVDPTYTSQVNYQLQTPCLLESKPPLGPDVDIAAGSTFESFTTWELAFDATDRERRGLALRKMYRTIAPWATENPILMHLISSDPAVIRSVVDQCAEAGFEMLILSFGSGLDMESEDPAYLAKFKEVADYAHGKGIEIGGYSLLASRRVDDATDAIDPATGKPGHGAFGHSPCLESRWGREYFRKIMNFFEKTGFDLLEHDGSYPGDVCASTAHPGHRGLSDSQWTQWRRITEFYKWCRGRGLSLNVPDWYFLAGSNKSAMGYREVNWSLPREYQVVL